MFDCVFCVVFNAVPKCCLHLGTDISTNEKIIPFTQKTIENCRKKKEIRDKNKKKISKFDDITLPIVIDETTGYHSSCFRSYCSVYLKKTDSSNSLMSVGSENNFDELNDDTTLESQDEYKQDGRLKLFIIRFYVHVLGNIQF